MTGSASVKRETRRRSEENEGERRGGKERQVRDCRSAVTPLITEVAGDVGTMDDTR